MHRTGTRMDDYKWSLEFKKKKEGWKGCEQEQIIAIQNETERMEKKEEAGYRSPTFRLLRALQQVNEATRIESETIMSAPLFFESAGRGYLKIWGTAEGPTMVIWESLSESEKTNWSGEKMSTSKDCVV